MYVDVVPNRKSPPAVLLRESWREGAKTRKRTLANLSGWPEYKIAALRRVLKNERLVGPDELLNIVRSLPHGHVAAVLGTLRKLRLDHLIDPESSPQRQRVLALIAARGLAGATARDTLAETAPALPGADRFEITTRPTPLQQKAFDLLAVKLSGTQ